MADIEAIPDYSNVLFSSGEANDFGNCGGEPWKRNFRLTNRCGAQATACSHLPVSKTSGGCVNQMNWDALAAIGELVGAGAVVISLIYLAIQIREQNREARFAAMHEIAAGFREVTGVGTDPDWAQVASRGLEDFQSLDEHEKPEAVSKLSEALPGAILSQFKARGAWLTGCQRAGSNAEVRQNGPGPSGWTLKSALAALPRLEMEPPFPAHGALRSPI